MKNKLNIIRIILVMLTLHQTISYAQFFQVASGNNWNINSGSYTVDKVNLSTSSASFPNAFYIDGANLHATTGDVFGTNGPSATTTNWKMSQNGSEKFRIENAASTNIVALGTIQNERFDIFTNGTANPRFTVSSTGDIGIGATSPGMKIDVKDGGNCNMRLQSTQSGGGNGNTYLQLNRSSNSQSSLIKYQSGLSGSITDDWFTGCKTSYDYTIWNGSSSAANLTVQQSTGNVGIGTTNPANLLQVHSGYLQLTNSTTNATGTDGFKIGMNSSDVELKQQENADMIFFTNNGTSTLERMKIKNSGNVGIGSTTAYSKLYVANDYSTSSAINGIEVLSENSGGSIKGIKIATTANSGNDNTGLEVTANNANSNVGIYSVAYNGVGANYAGYLYANGTTNTSLNIGAYGIAENGTNGYAGFFNATGASTLNVGIYASASGTGAVAGQFNGNATATGAFIDGSDSILKTNVNPLINGLAIVNSLQPKTYEFRTGDYPQMHLLNGNHAGVIAQDLEQVLPGLVFPLVQPAVYDAQGNITTPLINYKGVNYIELIPYLIGAIKEQQTQIQLLQAGQKAVINQNINPQQKTGAIEVKLSDNVLVLEQNQPNPFKENTTINFNIPDDVKNAQILFYNSKGNVISTVDILEKGAGSLMVYGSDLTSGIYTYTLLIDGSIAETKKMMKVK